MIKSWIMIPLAEGEQPLLFRDCALVTLFRLCPSRGLCMPLTTGILKTECFAFSLNDLNASMVLLLIRKLYFNTLMSLWANDILTYYLSFLPVSVLYRLKIYIFFLTVLKKICMAFVDSWFQYEKCVNSVFCFFYQLFPRWLEDSR